MAILFAVGLTTLVVLVIIEEFDNQTDLMILGKSAAFAFLLIFYFSQFSIISGINQWLNLELPVWANILLYLIIFPTTDATAYLIVIPEQEINITQLIIVTGIIYLILTGGGYVFKLTYGRKLKTWK